MKQLLSWCLILVLLPSVIASSKSLDQIQTGSFIANYFKNCQDYGIRLSDDYEFGLLEGSFLDEDMIITFDNKGIKTIMFRVGDIASNEAKMYKVFAFIMSLYQSSDQSLSKSELFPKASLLLDELMDAGGKAVPVVSGYKGFFDKLATQSIMIMKDIEE